jgi:hypothetical protein
MTDDPESRLPAMIGPSASDRGLPAIPADPAEHAIRFAREWEDVAETYVQRRMRELGILEDRIGAIEHAQGGARRAFDPDGRTGGTCDAFGRLYVDSGFLNPDLVAYLGGEANERWHKMSGRNRIDAIISHEEEETRGSHETALERAAETTLPISDEARKALRLIAVAEKPRRGQ